MMTDSHASHIPATPNSVAISRLFALSLAGLVMFGAVITFDIGAGSAFTPTLHIVAAASIALMLLVRAAVREQPELLRSRANRPLVALSLGASLTGACMVHALEWTDHNMTRAVLIAAFGTAAGLLVYVRASKLLFWCSGNPLPVFIAVVILSGPVFFYSYHTLAWQLTAGTTVALVKALLWLCGITVATTAKWQPSVLTSQGDFVATLQSGRFAVSISWICSGIEGMVLFCCLTSAFLLYDWRLFKNARRLVLLYPLLISVIIATNAVRIAIIFLYGSWLAHDAPPRTIPIAIVHSSAGLVLYTAVFALFLPLLYRWARRHTDETEPCDRD